MDDKTAIEILIQGAMIAYKKGAFNDNIKDCAYIISAIDHFKPELFAEPSNEQGGDGTPKEETK